MQVKGQRVAGKVALISGAAIGMGAAHARMLAAEGARVVIADIRDEEGSALAREIGEGALFVHLDVTSGEQWERAVATAEAAYGPVNVLVNNAGIVALGAIDQMTEAQYRRVIEVNQLGPFLGMRATVPSMRKAGAGSIINISSTAGFAGLPHLSAYSATKFAVRGMTKSASIELADCNIRVNSVHPGIIDTPMNTGASGAPKLQAIKRMGRPQEVSSMVLFLASDESSYCTGSEYVVDGGYLNVVGEVLI